MKKCPFTKCTARIVNYHFACKLCWNKMSNWDKKLAEEAIACLSSEAISHNEFERIKRNIVARNEIPNAMRSFTDIHKDRVQHAKAQGKERLPYKDYDDEE